MTTPINPNKLIFQLIRRHIQLSDDIKKLAKLMLVGEESELDVIKDLVFEDGLQEIIEEEEEKG